MKCGRSRATLKFLWSLDSRWIRPIAIRTWTCRDSMIDVGLLAYDAVPSSAASLPRQGSKQNECNCGRRYLLRLSHVVFWRNAVVFESHALWACCISFDRATGVRGAKCRALNPRGKQCKKAYS